MVSPRTVPAAVDCSPCEPDARAPRQPVPRAGQSPVDLRFTAQKCGRIELPGERPERVALVSDRSRAVRDAPPRLREPNRPFVTEHRRQERRRRHVPDAGDEGQDSDQHVEDFHGTDVSGSASDRGRCSMIDERGRATGGAEGDGCGALSSKATTGGHHMTRRPMLSRRAGSPVRVRTCAQGIQGRRRQRSRRPCG